MVKKSVLTHLTYEDVCELKNNSSVFWKGIKEIGDYGFQGLDICEIDVPNPVQKVGVGAFSDCFSLKRVFLSKSLKLLGSSTFENCEQLQSVENLGNIKSIENNTFLNCYNLTKVEIPQSCQTLGMGAFQNCINLQNVNLSENIATISSSAFKNCQSLKSVDLPKSLKKIGATAFAGCVNLEEIIIPDGVEEIDDRAFEECESLAYVFAPNSIYYWGNDVFENCSLRHIYANQDKSFEFSAKNLFGRLNSKHYDLTNCYENIIDFKFSGDMITYGKDGFNEIETYVKVAAVAAKNHIKLSSTFIAKLRQERKIEDFCSSNFKFFRQIYDMANNEIDADDLCGLLTFAYDIGCFSKDNNLAQKASEWLKERIATAEIRFNQMSRRFGSWRALGENAEFSDFIFGKSKNENITIFDQIRSEPDNINLFKRIYDEFCDNDSSLRPGGRFRDENGKLKFAVVHYYVDALGKSHAKRKDRVPTVALFKEFFDKVAFCEVEDEESRQIATELSKWSGMHQNDFIEAKKIMEEYHNNSIPANILGFHLHDLTKDVDNYKNQTQKLVEEGLSTAKEIANSLGNEVAKEFSFDWLEKNDPMNFCLGYYCNCCATLANVGYGILRSNFVDPNIQNLVIKSKNGEPVAKATAFVNREQGYVVFNTISVSNRVSEQQKDEIYDEFLLGVDAFAKAYNKQNPSNPIKVITVGMSNNALQEQIKKTKQKTRAKQGVDFAQFGSYLLSYQGDWSKKGGQYKLWDIKNVEEKSDDKRRV